MIPKSISRRLTAIVIRALALSTGAAFAQTEGWLLHMEAGNQLRNEAHHREALGSYRKALLEASDRKEIASAQNGIGVAWLALGDAREAEKQLKLALDNFEAASPGGPDHARVLLNLSSLFRWQRRFAEAEEANRRATVIQERAFGPDDPEVAASLNSRGVLLHDLSRCRESVVLLERALAIWVSAHGAGDRDSATVAHNLGISRACLSDYQEARRLLVLALEIRERALPPGHPDIALTLFACARVHEKLGARKQASAFRRRAQAISADHASANLLGLTIDASTLH